MVIYETGDSDLIMAKCHGGVRIECDIPRDR